MSVLLLVLALGVACSGDDASEKEKADAAAAPLPPPPSPEKQLAEARKLALSGQHDEALALADKVLSKTPKLDAAWRLVEQEALASGQARAVVERLDASKAIDGRVGMHFLLRAELALAAGMLPDAVASARLAAPEDANAAAALLARAALAGAPGVATPPAEGGPAPTGADALVLYALAADAAAAQPYAAAAKAVGGWRAALVRAGRAEAWGDTAGALAEYATAVADADVRAKIAGNLGRARLVAAHPAAMDGGPASAGAWAGEAATLALDEGAGPIFVEALKLSVDELVRAGRAADALKQVTDLRAKLPKEKVDPVITIGLSISQAQAALAAGKPADALEAAGKVRTDNPDISSDPDLAVVVREAAWIEGLAAHELGRAEAVSTAAAACEGGRQQVLLSLAALDAGNLSTAAASMPSGGLSDRDGAIAWQEAARAAPDQAMTWLSLAVDAADRSGELRLRVQTRLALESEARHRQDPKAAAVREALLGLAPAGAAGDPLRAEVGARALLAGGKASIPSDPALPPVVGAWAAMAASATPPAVGDDPLAPGVAGWASGHQSASTGSAEAAAAAWGEALGRLPLHRAGGWSLGTALDGSEGMPLDVEMALLGASPPVSAVLTLHELEHRRGWILSGVDAGLDPTLSLADDKRSGLRGAIAEARAGVASWLAGQGPYPKEALAAVVADEAGLAKDSPLAVLMPAKMYTLDELSERLGATGLVSYRLVGNKLQGVALSKKGNKVLDLGPAKGVYAAADAHAAALRNAAAGKGKTSPAAGEKLRSALIDPFADVLGGVGRYLVIAPPSLRRFPWTTLPEQAAGLRYLADIRAIGELPALRLLGAPQHTADPYHPDFLGFGVSSVAATTEAPPAEAAEKGKGGKAPKEGKAKEGKAEDGAEKVSFTLPPPPVEIPMTDELGVTSRVFSGGLKTVLVGDKATRAAYKAKSEAARYIHFTALPASPDGGFVLQDGALTLAEVQAAPLAATLVVITAPASAEVQNRRAEAFLAAGARGVIVQLWDLPDQTRVRFLGSFYEAIARDRTPSRALSEARDTFVHDELAGPGQEDPGAWGAFALIGLP